MNKTILSTGVFFGLLAVVLGAFGSHGLKTMIEPGSLRTFEIGVRYQMYHALFLLFLGIWQNVNTKHKKIVYLFILVGIVLFSFSIYGLALNSLIAFDFRAIGFLTPMGGVFLILGWALAAYCVLTQKVIK